MVRKSKRFIKSPTTLLEIYDFFNECMDFKKTAAHFDISYAQTHSWITAINGMLAGEPNPRIKGRRVLDVAVKTIKAGVRVSDVRDSKPGNVAIPISLTNVITPERAMTTEQRVDFIWNQLLEAIGQLATEMADEKVKDIRDEYESLKANAQKSNIVGFIKTRWSTRT